MKTLTDLHRDIEKQFPGIVSGVSNSKAPYVNQWLEDVTDEQKKAVNDFIAAYDLEKPTELEEMANKLSTEDFMLARQKLEHAQVATDETKKATLIAEANTIYDTAKEK